MSFSERYQKWSTFKQTLFILLAVALVGALASCAFIFIENIGVLLGWLLGSAINIFAFVSISKGASFTLDPNDTKGHKAILVAGFGMLRVMLYGGALLLAGFASFRWGSLEHGYCNIISTALALMPNWIVLLIHTFASSKKKPEEKKEEPEGDK